jgi:Zn-dependent protease
MAIITLMEVVDVIIMTAVLGFIFMSFFKKRPVAKDIIDVYKQRVKGFQWNDFWFAVAVIAPAIVLHEAAHKFVAMGFGMQAVFHAHYTFLGLGLLLKLLNFGFIFVVPGFVSITGTGTPLQFATIAFAGPFIHLLFWIIAAVYLKYGKTKNTYFWVLTKKINMFLFILNMLPIPGIDGFKVYSGLLSTIF